MGFQTKSISLAGFLFIFLVFVPQFKLFATDFPASFTADRQPGSVIWYVTLHQDKPLPPTLDSLPELDHQPLFWLPEMTSTGERLGWKLVLGSPEDNLLADKSIPHGRQTFEFFGWHFLQEASGTLPLLRQFELPQGLLETRILDFEIREKELVALSIRCSWSPRRVH